jgi:hypothetical protein
MGFGTKSEPPQAGRSLPLISVLAGLARSSHQIVAEALVGPEANERQSNDAVPFWHECSAALRLLSAMPLLGQRSVATAVRSDSSRYHSRTIPQAFAGPDRIVEWSSHRHSRTRWPNRSGNMAN